MKIKKLSVSNFMIFDRLETEFSPNINIICGENSTGKTALLKLLYSCTKAYSDVGNAKEDLTKAALEKGLVSKFQGVFRPDRDAIGRLVTRKPGSNRADITIDFDFLPTLKLGFGNRKEKTLDDDSLPKLPQKDACRINSVYIPPKEIISSTENFVSLYHDYHIAFEETYYDLARLLERPLKKGSNSTEQNSVLKCFEKIVNGKIIQRDKSFFLHVSGSGEFEMGLVSEGYRKISTIMYLISSGSLSENSILFWDEPETNMNPKMIKPIVDAIIELSKIGVQVFITTHDYFIQQCFSMASRFLPSEKDPLSYKFISLYKTESDKDHVYLESADTLSELDHNTVMEEFDLLYDREMDYLNGDYDQ